MRHTTPVLSRVIRPVSLLCVGVWGWYLAAMFRTSDWGYYTPAKAVLTTIAAFGIFALPLAFLPLIGIPMRRKLIAIGLLLLLCTASVELFARGQEYLLIRKLGHQPVKDHTETRWWPFETHSIGVARGQWWGCD